MKLKFQAEVLVKLLKEKSAPVHQTSAAVAPSALEAAEFNRELEDDVKPNFRRGRDVRDETRRAAHLRAKEKRLSQRRRRQASLHPQGLEEPGFESDQGLAPERLELKAKLLDYHSYFKESIDKFGWNRNGPIDSAPDDILSEDSPRMKWADEVMSVTSGITRTSEAENMTEILVKLTGFVLGLANCRTQGEATRLALTVLTQYFRVAYVEEVYKWCCDDMTPQSSSTENIFSKIRFQVTTLSETRGGKFLFNVFSLAVMSGFSAKKLVPFEETKYFLKKIEADIYRSSSLKSCLDCVLDIGDYVASAYAAFHNGTSFKEFFFPNALQQEIVDCKILAERINTGDANTEDPDYLDSCIEQMSALETKLSKIMLETGDSKTHRWVQAGYDVVKRSRQSVELVQASASFRYKPIMIGLYGESQIGKTVMVTVVGDVVAAATNTKFNPCNVATQSDKEKYEDSIKNNTKMLIVDDIGSLKETPGDPASSTAAAILRMVNNVAQPTNQSDVANKGKIYHREELIVLTSNVRDFGTRGPFKVPLAAVNRMWTYEMILRPEYTVPGKKILDEAKAGKAQAATPGGMVDLHTFQRYEYYCPNKENSTEMAYKPVGVPLNTRDFLLEIGQRARNHYNQQLALRELQRMRTETAMCEKCFLHKGSYCQCVEEPVEPAMVNLRAESLFSAYAFSVMDEMAMNAVWHTSRYAGRLITGQFARVVQRNAFRTAVFVLTTSLGAFRYLKHKEMRICAFLVALWLWYANYLLWLDSASIWQLLLTGCGFFMIAFLGYGNAVMDAFAYEATRSMLNKQTRSILCTSLAVCSFIGVVRRLYHMQAGADEPFEHAADGIAVPPEPRGFTAPVVRRPEGNILPKVYRDVVERHKEVNPWQPGSERPVVFTNEARTMTFDQVTNRVNKSFFKITFTSKTKRASCFTLHLCDTIWAVSKHVFQSMEDPNCQVELSRPGHILLMSQVSAHYVPEDPMCDTVLIQLLGIGSFPDTTRFLPEGGYKDQMLKFVTRRGNDLVVDNVYGRMGLISTTSKVLPHSGIIYNRREPTIEGDCGSMLFTENNPHGLVGFHCAGDAQGNCAAAIVKMAWVHEFQQQTCNFKPEGSNPMPFALGDDVDLNPYSLGETVRTDFFLEHTVLKRHTPGCNVEPVAYLPHSKVRPKTQLSYGILYESLKKQEMPIEHGPPSFHVDRDHDGVLEAIHNGMRLIDPALMRKAISDYVEPLKAEIREKSMSKIPPLDLEQVLNGVEENRFIGPMKETTAAGFGAKGKKTRDFIDVTYDVTGKKILAPTDLLQRKFEEGLKRLERGERLNPVFRTSLKDEPVKLDMETGEPRKLNRVFYSCQTDTLCLAKALFAPIAAAVFEFPLTSECAGGLNSFGDEWGQAYEYLIAFGKDRILAGDFKNWDQSLSSQVIRACGLVCMHIGEALGYTQQQLIALNGLISDIAVSYVAYNGCLSAFDGLMPSGTFCTLLFNSIANSLIHRCAFFAPGFDGTFEHNDELSFRDLNRFLFLGDDSIGGSKVMSQRDVKAFCDSVGLVYTDDKKSMDHIEAYQHIDNVNFCKRTFRYEPYIGHHLAPLALSSIDKALLMYREGDMDPQTYAIQAVESQMREYARHEDSVFEQRRKIVTNACLDAGIYVHLVDVLGKSRQDWLDDFHHRYFANSENDFSDLTDMESI